MLDRHPGRGADEQTIIYAIEASLWDYEPKSKPKGLVYVERPGLTMWASEARSLHANKVVRSVFTEDSTDREIDEVIEFFQSRERSFTWTVGPGSRPSDLAQRLMARGFAEFERYDGLALSLSDDPCMPLPAPVVEVETERQAREYVNVSVRAFGHDQADTDRRVAEIMEYLKLPGRRGGYLVGIIEGSVVGNAAWRDSSDGSTVYLTGGATLPEYRGKGVYTSLLARRLEPARERGKRLAVVRARTDSSSPILRKHGFRRYCGFRVYSYQIQSEQSQ